MQLHLLDVNGNAFEVDTDSISSIVNMYSSKDVINSVITFEEFNDVKKAKKNIQDIFETIYRRGYNEGRTDKEKYDVYNHQKEEQKEPKSYILAENGEYINVNQIVSLKPFKRDNKDMVEIETTGASYYSVEIPIEDLLNILAAKQEELNET